MDTTRQPLVTFGDRVRIKKQGYEGAQGKVQFIGEMEGNKHKIFYGIELDKKNGRYDGSFLNKRYFKCSTRKGLFITIQNISKIIKKAKSQPRVTVNSTVYVTKCECNGRIKYIGVPFIDKNKSRHLFYGIELEEAKGKNNGTIHNSRYFRCAVNHGIFVKKDGFEYTVDDTTQQQTPGGPDNNNTERRKSRKYRDKDIPKDTASLRRSKSNNAKSLSKLKQKLEPKNIKRSNSRPKSASNSRQIKKVNKKTATFKRNSSTKKKSKANMRTSLPPPKPIKKTSSTRGRSRTTRGNTLKVTAKPRIQRPKSASYSAKTHKNTIHNVQKNDDDDDDDDEEEEDDDDDNKGKAAVMRIKSLLDNLDIGSDDTDDSKSDDDELEAEALAVIGDTLAIKNYRIFIPCIGKVRSAVGKLDKVHRQKVINYRLEQCHDNDLVIWQNILHLALFIVRAMHSFYSLSEKKECWDFIDFLLQNGASPLIAMTIKQDDIYEHKNVFRLMTEALKTYKQNDLLIVSRFSWLWSLVGTVKPSIISFDSCFNNSWIIADGYNELPSPRILKEYLDFGCDLVHIIPDSSYYIFNDSLLESISAAINMYSSFIDIIGRCVLYYKHYISLRIGDLKSILPSISSIIIEDIVSFTVVSISIDIDILSDTLRVLPNYSRDWREFLFKYVLFSLNCSDKVAIKERSKSWDNDSEWDYFIANLKKKHQFICCIDLFEHLIGYKTAQKISDFYIKKNNLKVIQTFMISDNAFKYLELYNLLFNYSLKRNLCAKFIFSKLVDLANCKSNKQKSIKLLRSEARKELNNLYVQFCRHQVNDWMFQQNLLFILKELKTKKKYRFDFECAIKHCFKAKQLNTLIFLIDNKLLTDVERAARLFYCDDVIKRIIFGMQEFDEQQEDFLKLILNWTWQYKKNKNHIKTWYQKWLNDAISVQDEECKKIIEVYHNLE